MNKNKLLNSELNYAIASLGHGDLMIVCDAGFPYPRRTPGASTWRSCPTCPTWRRCCRRSPVTSSPRTSPMPPRWRRTTRRCWPSPAHLRRQRLRTNPTRPSSCPRWRPRPRSSCARGAFDPWGNISALLRRRRPGLVLQARPESARSLPQACGTDAERTVILTNPASRGETTCKSDQPM